MSGSADRRLIEDLIRSGRLRPEQAQAALAEQQRRGGPERVALAVILGEHGLLGPSSVDAARAPTVIGSQAAVPIAAASDASAAALRAPVVTHGQLPPDVADAVARGARWIGRHVVLETLGRGGMGVVYRAWDTSLRRDVALKMITAQAATSPTGRERFVREAQAIARLEHENIVSLHEVGEHDGLPFIVMEYVKGKTLGALLQADEMPRERLLEVAVALARALHHAHERGIVHRDVKPANVMIAEGSGGRPLLMDFGLARDASAREQLTLTGQVLGTPAFMAPEQVDDERGKPGPATDVYGLGAVLYYGLTHLPPVEATDTFSAIKHIIADRPKSPRSIDPSVPAALDAIVMRCLEKRPARRFPSADALGDALERAMGPARGKRRSASASASASSSSAERAGARAAAGGGGGLVTAGVLAATVIAGVGGAFAAGLFDSRSAPATEVTVREPEVVPDPAPDPDPDPVVVPDPDPEPTGTEPVSESNPESADPEVTPVDPPPVDPPAGAPWRRVLAEARRLSGEGDHAAALAELASALDLVANDAERAEVLHARARVHLDAKQPEAARADLDAAIEADQLNVDALVLRARVRRESEPEAADDDLARAMRADPARWEPYYERARVRSWRRPRLSIADLTEALARAPKSMHRTILLRRADMCRRARDHRGELADVEALIAHSAKPSASLIGRRGVVRRALGDEQGALADYRAALELEPDNDVFRANLGYLHYGMGNDEEALAELGRAIALRRRPIYFVWRGDVHRRRGENELAREEYTAAIGIDDEHAAAWRRRGVVRRRLGDLDGAIADATRALELIPRNPTGWGDRGLARLEKGDREGAANDFREFVTRKPKPRNPNIAPVREALQKLGLNKLLRRLPQPAAGASEEDDEGAEGAPEDE